MKPLILKDIAPRRWDCSKSLFFAASQNDAGLAEKVVTLGTDVNTSQDFWGILVRPWGTTPLAAAICYRHERMVCWLLKAGAYPCSRGDPSVFMCAMNKAHEILCTLLKEWGQIEQFHLMEEELLHWACEAEIPDFARALFEGRIGEKVSDKLPSERSRSCNCMVGEHGFP